MCVLFIINVNLIVFAILFVHQINKLNDKNKKEVGG
jgi:hypothetical protein